MRGGQKIVRSNTKRPPKGYTNEQWQSDFIAIKSEVQKSRASFIYDSYYQVIPDRSYSDFINDILDIIRTGGTDYCFYVYQIADLLQYEYDDLCVDWIEGDECFQVSLRNSHKKKI